MPPGPPMGVREGGMPPNGGAASLQAKMNRQRQLALERQRVSARKQLGAGVIASSNPLMQSSPFRGGDWDQIVPDKLGISPSAKKETRSPGDFQTAPNSPQESSPTERSELPTTVKSGSKADFDDALDGLAEELLLDDRHPGVGPLKRAAEPAGLGSSSPSRPFGQPAAEMPVIGPKPGSNAWGGDAPHKAGVHPNGSSLTGIDEDSVLEGSLEPSAVRGVGLQGRFSNRKQQTLVLDEDHPEAAVGPIHANNGLRPPITPPAQPGKSWDLNVEVHEPKTDPGRRSKAGGKSWWPFSGANGGGPEGKEEVVTEISSFTFD